jgi:PAS domain S-box-containing protein
MAASSTYLFGMGPADLLARSTRRAAGGEDRPLSQNNIGELGILNGKKWWKADRRLAARSKADRMSECNRLLTARIYYAANIKAPRMSTRSALHKFIRRFRSSDRSAEVYRSILEQSADVICHVEDGRFTYISPSAFDVFGWDVEALIGKDALSTVHRDDAHVVLDMIAGLTPGDTDPVTTRVRAVCGDGSIRWCETTNRLTINGSGGRRGVLVMRDISERKRLEEELEALALRTA